MMSFAGILAFVVVLLASPGSVLTQGAVRVAPHIASAGIVLAAAPLITEQRPNATLGAFRATDM